ncbi:hypothetical protein HMPREF9282_00528 [Veillonella seminalis ACS-216-V-Col6b]|uniref:Uncharacterized protein n=1 Tax=Veillonella seminalis ACS-216-V-Col6b TaxID=883156 RepID=K9D686_9FIRM|nr:hypothetical protein HMPREF9282_00528 [Veillonella seminalis ACS-216-V-Col6b]
MTLSGGWIMHGRLMKLSKRRRIVYECAGTFKDNGEIIVSQNDTDEDIKDLIRNKIWEDNADFGIDDFDVDFYEILED